MEPLILWLVPAFAGVALLYGSVGHGGASGYLAIMALAGLAPEAIRPAALSLNLVVSLVAALRFGRAGHLRMGLLLPFAAASVPAAFLGGAMPIRPDHYELLLGGALLLAGIKLIREGRKGGTEEAVSPAPQQAGPPLGVALVAGAVIGFASGLVGVGGGIFLSPLVLLMGWASPRETAALSAPFIFLNSGAGLTGQVLSGAVLPAGLPVWAAAVLLGGWLGATYGSRRARPATLRLLLGVVLVVASLKLLAGG